MISDNGQIAQGTLLDNRYSVVRKIGEGGMGEVYLAIDKKTSCEVAIKLLRSALASTDEHKQRFLQESKLCAKINHRNVVKVVASFFHCGFPCFAMEYVKGNSLRDLLDEGQRKDKIIPIIIDTLDAIYSAHQLSIIHRDLKPSNILITEDGIVKVSDWGIAKATNDPTGMTKTGMIIGTPDYISPERITEGKSLPQGDIYSIGCILYESLCGHPPFTGSITQIVSSHIKEAPEPLKNASNELREFIAKLMTKDASLRPHNALEARNELKAIYERMPSASSKEAKTISFKAPGTPPHVANNAVKVSGKASKIAENASSLAKGAAHAGKGNYPLIGNPNKGLPKKKIRVASALIILLFTFSIVFYLRFYRNEGVESEQASNHQLRNLISKVHAVDFNTLEFRYDSKLGGKYKYRIKKEKSTEEGVIDFGKSSLSSGRFQSIQIDLEDNCYEDITLRLITEPELAFEISMKALYEQNFEYLQELNEPELVELFKKFAELKKIETEYSVSYRNLLASHGMSPTLLDKQKILIPQYLKYINYGENLYSKRIEVLEPLRQISSFLAYRSIHPVFGLLSKEMGFQFIDHENPPRYEHWNTMVELELRRIDSNNQIHYPILFYDLNKINDSKLLMDMTRRTGMLASMAFASKTALDHKDLVPNCVIPLKTTGRFKLLRQWPPSRARIDTVFISYDVDNYFSVTVNDHKPIHCFKTWKFASVVGKRVSISLPVPVSWLNKDKNVVDIIPHRLTKEKRTDIFQTVLEKVRLRVQFD